MADAPATVQVKVKTTTPTQDDDQQGPAAQEQANTGSMFGEVETQHQPDPAEPRENANASENQKAALKHIANSDENLEVVASLEEPEIPEVEVELTPREQAVQDLVAMEEGRLGITLTPEQKAELEQQARQRLEGITDEQLSQLGQRAEMAFQNATNKREIAKEVEFKFDKLPPEEQMYILLAEHGEEKWTNAKGDQQALSDVATQKYKQRLAQAEENAARSNEKVSEREKAQIAYEVAREDIENSIKEREKNKKTLIEIEDIPAFQRFLAQNPQIKELIDKKTPLEEIAKKLPQMTREVLRDFYMYKKFIDLQLSINNPARIDDKRKEQATRLNSVMERMKEKYGVEPGGLPLYPNTAKDAEPLSKEEEKYTKQIIDVLNKKKNWGKLLEWLMAVGLIVVLRPGNTMLEGVQQDIAQPRAA